MPTTSRYSKGNRQGAGKTPTDKNLARRAGAKKAASVGESIGKVRLSNIAKNRNSIKGTSSDPAKKTVMKIGANAAKGATRARPITKPQGNAIKGGFQVARGGGATPATTKYNNNQTSVGALNASNAQPKVKFAQTKSAGNNNGGARPAKVRKTQ